MDAKRSRPSPNRLRVIDVLKTPQEGSIDMASRGKKKTTMAKLTRESRLRDRRLEKQAKKEARKQASADHPGQPGDVLTGDVGESVASGAGQPAVEPVVQALTDA